MSSFRLRSGVRSLGLGQFAALACLSVVTGLSVSGCAPPERAAATAPAGSNVSQTDLNFVTNAYNVVEFDRLAAAQAQTRAADPRVRALAADLLREANAFRDQVKPIADSMGIQPPDTVTFAQRPDLQVRVSDLIRTGGPSYDRGFLDDEIATHREALRRQQDMAGGASGDPRLRALSGQGTEILRTNLAKLEALRRQVSA